MQCAWVVEAVGCGRRSASQPLTWVRPSQQSSSSPAPPTPVRPHIDPALTVAGCHAVLVLPPPLGFRGPGAASVAPGHFLSPAPTLLTAVHSRSFPRPPVAEGRAYSMSRRTFAAPLISQPRSLARRTAGVGTRRRTQPTAQTTGVRWQTRVITQCISGRQQQQDRAVERHGCRSSSRACALCAMHADSLHSCVQQQNVAEERLLAGSRSFPRTKAPSAPCNCHSPPPDMLVPSRLHSLSITLS